MTTLARSIPAEPVLLTDAEIDRVAGGVSLLASLAGCFNQVPLEGIVNLVGYKACVIVRQYGPELHAAIWTHVSCRHIRKASARARRY
jgi:hypothetical protein